MHLKYIFYKKQLHNYLKTNKLHFNHSKKIKNSGPNEESRKDIMRITYKFGRKIQK